MMKRTMMAVLALTLAGCAAPAADAAATPVPAETAEAVKEEEKAGEAADEISGMDLLAGSWALTAGGIPEAEPDIILTVSAADRLITVSRKSTAEAIAGTFAGSGGPGEAPTGLMTISFFGSRPEGMSYSAESYFQVRLGEKDGKEILILRENGDGNHFMAEAFLEYGRQTEDGFWIFERLPEEETG